MSNNSIGKTRIGLLGRVAMSWCISHGQNGLTCHIMGWCRRSYVECGLLDIPAETVPHYRKVNQQTCPDVELNWVHFKDVEQQKWSVCDWISTLTTKTAGFFVTVVCTHNDACCHWPDNYSLNMRHSGALKSYVIS
jgi:hypothetical protein